MVATRKRQRADVEERLWRSVRRAPEGCWECSLGRMKNGYTRINVDGVMKLAHRVAYEVSNGPIPDGQEVRHICDNRPCCRPSHLTVGTHAENMQDGQERGGFIRGSLGRYIKVRDY